MYTITKTTINTTTIVKPNSIIINANSTYALHTNTSCLYTNANTIYCAPTLSTVHQRQHYLLCSNTHTARRSRVCRKPRVHTLRTVGGRLATSSQSKPSVVHRTPILPTVQPTPEPTPTVHRHHLHLLLRGKVQQDLPQSTGSNYPGSRRATCNCSRSRPPSRGCCARRSTSPDRRFW